MNGLRSIGGGAQNSLIQAESVFFSDLIKSDLTQDDMTSVILVKLLKKLKEFSRLHYLSQRTLNDGVYVLCRFVRGQVTHKLFTMMILQNVDYIKKLF